MSARIHDIESRDCWCKPDLNWLCPTCEGRDEDCWRCGGDGWIVAPEPPGGDPETPCVVVHHESPDCSR